MDDPFVSFVWDDVNVTRCCIEWERGSRGGKEDVEGVLLCEGDEEGGRGKLDVV